jgi:hypothetical protein
LVERAVAGDDAVFGIRANRHDPWYRRWGAAAYHAVGRRVLGIEMPAGATTFRVVRTDLARRVVDLRLGTPYFLATVPRLTNRYSTVPVAHRPRAHGRSKLRLPRLISHAIELAVGFAGGNLRRGGSRAACGGCHERPAVAAALGWLEGSGVAAGGLAA